MTPADWPLADGNVAFCTCTSALGVHLLTDAFISLLTIDGHLIELSHHSHVQQPAVVGTCCSLIGHVLEILHNVFCGA